MWSFLCPAAWILGGWSTWSCPSLTTRYPYILNTWGHVAAASGGEVAFGFSNSLHKERERERVHNNQHYAKDIRLYWIVYYRGVLSTHIFLLHTFS